MIFARNVSKTEVPPDCRGVRHLFQIVSTQMVSAGRNMTELWNAVYSELVVDRLIYAVMQLNALWVVYKNGIPMLPRISPLTHLPLDEMAAILTEDIFKCIFLNENYRILILILLKFVARGPVDNKSSLVKVMAWRQETTSHYLKRWWPSSLTHIYGTKEIWLKLLPMYPSFFHNLNVFGERYLHSIRWQM